MESRLLPPKSQLKKNPAKNPCPQTWKVASILCFSCFFFLSGVLLGCYVGVMQSCETSNSEAVSDAMAKMPSRDEDALKVPFIEVLNSHQNILSLIQNSDLTYNPPWFEDLVEGKSAQVQTVLSSLDLYDTKHFPYEVMAIREEFQMKFESNPEARLVEEDLEVQLWQPFNAMALDTDVTITRDSMQHNASVEGTFVLTQFDRKSLIQNVAELSKRRVGGVLMHSSEGKCLNEDKAWLRGYMRQVSKQYNLTVRVLSCKLQSQLHSFLAALPRDTEIKAHLSLQTTVQPLSFSNSLSTFYGSRDPDLIVLLGSSICNGKGTERWLKVLTAVSQALSQQTAGRIWSPYKSIKFVSWSRLGVHQLIKTYKEAWRNKVLVYLDLDNPVIKHPPPPQQLPHPPPSKITIEASPSLHPFLQTVVQQLSFNNPDSTAIEVVANEGTSHPSDTPALLLESSMGIPYVRILEMPEEQVKVPRRSRKPRRMQEDEAKKQTLSADVMVLKLFSTVTLLMVDGELVQLSVRESADAVMRLLEKQLTSLHERDASEEGQESSGKEVISLLEDVSTSCIGLLRALDDLSASMELFSQSFEASYQARRTNDMLIRIENDLRLIRHHLSLLLADSTALDVRAFSLTSLSAHFHNGVFEDWKRMFFLTPCRSPIEGDSMQDPFSDARQCGVLREEEEVLRDLLEIDQKLQGLARVVSLKE